MHSEDVQTHRRQPWHINLPNSFSSLKRAKSTLYVFCIKPDNSLTCKSLVCSFLKSASTSCTEEVCAKVYYTYYGNKFFMDEVLHINYLHLLFQILWDNMNYEHPCISCSYIVRQVFFYYLQKIMQVSYTLHLSPSTLIEQM